MTKQNTASAAAQKKSRKMVKSMQLKLLSLACFVLIIALWCIASYGRLVEEVFLPSPTAVLSRLFSMAADGSLWAHCRASIARVMIGWIWSVIVALPMGMLMVIEVPSSLLLLIVIVPPHIFSMRSRFLGTFFQLVLMVADTVSNVDVNMINAAKTLGANRFQIYKEVIFPAALPGLIDDFRLTIGWAWTYLVVAEMVAASNGLGFMILRSQRYLATDTIFAGLIMIGRQEVRSFPALRSPGGRRASDIKMECRWRS